MIMIFSISMGAEYLSYVKSIATFAPIFLGYLYYFSLNQCDTTTLQVHTSLIGPSRIITAKMV